MYVCVRLAGNLCSSCVCGLNECRHSPKDSSQQLLGASMSSSRNRKKLATRIWAERGEGDLATWWPSPSRANELTVRPAGELIGPRRAHVRSHPHSLRHFSRGVMRPSAAQKGPLSGNQGDIHVASAALVVLGDVVFNFRKSNHDAKKVRVHTDSWRHTARSDPSL